MYDSCMSKVLACVVSPAAKTVKLFGYKIEFMEYIVCLFIKVCINSFGRKEQSYLLSKKLNYSKFLIPVDIHNP